MTAIDDVIRIEKEYWVCYNFTDKGGVLIRIM